MKSTVPFLIDHRKIYTVSELIADLKRIEARGGGAFKIWLNYDMGDYCTVIEVEDYDDDGAVVVSLG